MKDSVEQLNECYREGECQKHPEASESASTLGSANKPPLGLRPRRIANQQRMVEIAAAIGRYSEANKQIPQEWLDEFNELLAGL